MPSVPAPESSSAVSALLRSAARYPLLTPAQEVQLGRAIRAWQDWPDGPTLAPARVRQAGKRALDRFVCSNLKLAYRIARRYEGRGVALEDLVQCAVEGLIAACIRFKPELGYRSSSYSVWWMRLHCQQAVAAHGNGIKIPQRVHDIMGKMGAVKRQWLQRRGIEPTHEEIAEALGLSADQLSRVIETARLAQVHSLDSAPGEDEDGGLHERLGVVDPAPDTAALEERQRIRSVVSEILDPQERAVVELLHLSDEPVSVARCSRALNLSRSRVQQLNRRAMERLRRPVGLVSGQVLVA